MSVIYMISFFKYTLRFGVVMISVIDGTYIQVYAVRVMFRGRLREMARSQARQRERFVFAVFV